MKFFLSRLPKILLGVAVTAFCIWLAIRPILGEQDTWTQFGNEFRKADYTSAPLILALLFVFFWLKAWRWRLLLAPVADYKPMRDLFSPIMIGFAFNNVLPLRMGEFVRCYVFGKQQNQSMTMTISTVFLERVFDSIAILVYLAVGLSFVPPREPMIRVAAWSFGGVMGVLALGGVAYLIWTKPMVAITEWILARMVFIPESLRNRICRMLENGAEGLACLKSVRLVLGLLVISFVKWLLNGAIILLSLWAFHINVTPMVALTLLGAVALSVSLPTVPGYFGVVQAAFSTTLAGLVTNMHAVLAASIYYHLANFIPVTILGLILFNLSGISLKQIEDAKDHEVELEEAPLGEVPGVPQS
jgi:hypothetical protein